MAASRHVLLTRQTSNRANGKIQAPLGLGRTLKGLKLGIWGYGKIGRCIAQYAQAFGMNVMVWGSQTSRDQTQ